MAGATLIDSIRERADRDVDAVWQQARADADAYRDAAARRIEDERARAAAEVAARVAAARADANATASADARRIRGAAKAALADRLRTVAIGLLAHFRGDRYSSLFEALCRELPSRAWTRVVVHPADVELARIQYPRADIGTDAGIAGGLIVEADGIRINNTLDARLRAAWSDLLAAAIHDVEEGGGG